MRSFQIYFIIIILILITILLGFQYLVSIYEVDIRIDPDVLYADNKSECVVYTVPLNSLGWRVPFRNASAKIEIREGSDLVEILEIDEQKGILRIRAKDKTGIVVIFIRPEKALLPSSFEIIINPNFT
jgi:hypothetical protein